MSLTLTFTRPVQKVKSLLFDDILKPEYEFWSCLVSWTGYCVTPCSSSLATGFCHLLIHLPQYQRGVSTWILVSLKNHVFITTRLSTILLSWNSCCWVFWCQINILCGWNNRTEAFDLEQLYPAKNFNSSLGHCPHSLFRKTSNSQN